MKMPSFNPWKDWGEPSRLTLVVRNALRTRESVGVADDQRVLRNPADEALGDGAELAVLHGAHAEGAHDDQVIVGGEAVLDEHLVVLAVDHLALEGEPRGLGAPGHDVEVGIGDEL